MMNLVCADVGDPSSFATDDSFSPTATRFSKKITDGGEDIDRSKATDASSSAASSLRTCRRSRLPLVVRFVSARLLHYQLHVLSKIGGDISGGSQRAGTPSPQELVDAERLFADVSGEIAELGPELVPREVALVDADFTRALGDTVRRLAELQDCAGVQSARWYGAAQEQMESNAVLLVANRKLERENGELQRRNKSVEEKLERLVAAREEQATKHVQEIALQRQRAEQYRGGQSTTAKLQEEMAMKEAEKSAMTNGASSSADMAKIEVARSLRLQDEVVVLRKAATTLQLTVSRIQHQYGTLLDEHEKLKAEIRHVVATQDAEENDIRRIFVEREREFDVAMRSIASLKKDLEKSEKRNAQLQKRVDAQASALDPALGDASNRRLSRQQSNLQLLRTRSGVEQFQQSRNSLVPAVPSDDEDDKARMVSSKHRSSFREGAGANDDAAENPNSLAARMKDVRAKTVPVLASAYTAPPPSIDTVIAGVEDEETSNDSNKETDRVVVAAPPPPPPEDYTIRVEDDDDDDDHDHDDDDDDIFVDEMMGSDDDEKIGTPDDSARRSARRTARARHVSTMTDDRERKGASRITVGTQTFFKTREFNSSSGRSGGDSSSAHSRTMVGESGSAAAASAAAAAAIAASSSDTTSLHGALLEKLTRLVNRQANVIERFLSETVTTNVVLHRKDLDRLLKQFGIPTGGDASSTTWQGVLHRFPSLSACSLSSLEAEVEAALSHAIATASSSRKVEMAVQTEHTAGMFDDCSGAGTARGGAAHQRQNNSPNSNRSRTPGRTSAAPFPSTLNQLPQSFWNANDAVNALRRVYVDAGRLIDTVEREQQEVVVATTPQQSPSSPAVNHSVGDAVLPNESGSAAAVSAAARRVQRPASASSRSASVTPGSAAAATAAAASAALLAAQNANAERIATEQFFAIRALEGSCNLLVQRLAAAKEEYVRRFAERSSLLNQTLGQVSRTHPREANRLSRLAKSVAQARTVLPWMTGFVEHFDSQQHTSSGFSPLAAGAPVQSSSSPLVFRASEILQGKVHPALAFPVATSSSHHFSS